MSSDSRCRWLAALVAGALLASPAGAATVEGLSATHRNGQTFLTWTSPPGTGWSYRVLRASHPIAGPSDLADAADLGRVGDSTWYDRRLSVIQGATYAFAIDSLAPPLPASSGLFVATPEAAGAGWYAVLCDSAASGEDPAVVPGRNALAAPVLESLDLARPVYQRSFPIFGLTMEVYTLWTSPAGNPIVPPMCNRPSFPFDCGLIRGRPGPFNALMVRTHSRGMHFMHAPLGTGRNDEWVLDLDDPTWNPDRNTWWVGMNDAYDLFSASNVPPLSGIDHDYTARRAFYTAEWALRSFPVNRQRVYAMGSSMGASGALFLTLFRPDLFAAGICNVPRVNFAHLSDFDPICPFNPGKSERLTVDRLWGTVATDLATDGGVRMYDWMNAGWHAARLEPLWVPPLIVFFGKHDNTVGWTEKIGFFDAFQRHRAGGIFFFDQRAHTGTTTGAWWPMLDFLYLYRFASDRSFPALSRCSLDGDPGDGNPATGDSIGVFNAFVEWDTALVDVADAWQVRLTMRDLASRWGVVPAADSCVVDVTPRRLRNFRLAPGERVAWSVTRSATGDTLQRGTVTADGFGLATVPGVRVLRTGSVLRLAPGPPVASVPRAEGPVAGPEIAGVPSVLRSACVLRVTWHAAGEARLDLVDVAGRIARSIQRGPVAAGPQAVPLDPGGLPSGVYVLRARQGDAAAVRRVAVLH